MTLIVDASGIYAQVDRGEPAHDPVRDVLRSDAGPFVTSELAVAQADHVVLTRFGVGVELALVRDLIEVFDVQCLDRDELRTARDLIARYRDLEIGLADASLVVLARRYGTRRILTLDERDFRAVRPLQGGAFTLLPADAE